MAAAGSCGQRCIDIPTPAANCCSAVCLSFQKWQNLLLQVRCQLTVENLRGPVIVLEAVPGKRSGALTIFAKGRKQRVNDCRLGASLSGWLYVDPCAAASRTTCARFCCILAKSAGGNSRNCWRIVAIYGAGSAVDWITLRLQQFAGRHMTGHESQLHLGRVGQSRRISCERVNRLRRGRRDSSNPSKGQDSQQ